MLGVVGIVERSVPERHDAIADVFVDRAAPGQDQVGHRGQEAVDQAGQPGRVGLELLGDRGKAADVAEHDAEHAGFAAELQPLGVRRQRRHQFGREVVPERRLDGAALAIDKAVAKQEDRRRLPPPSAMQPGRRAAATSHAGRRSARRRPSRGSARPPPTRRQPGRQESRREPHRDSQERDEGDGDRWPGRRVLADKAARQDRLYDVGEALGAGDRGVARNGPAYESAMPMNEAPMRTMRPLNKSAASRPSTRSAKE